MKFKLSLSPSNMCSVNELMEIEPGRKEVSFICSSDA